MNMEDAYSSGEFKLNESTDKKTVFFYKVGPCCYQVKITTRFYSSNYSAIKYKCIKYKCNNFL